jgi:hypothetical protein
MLPTWPAHPILLDLITLIKVGEEYKIMKLIITEFFAAFF